MTVASLVGRRLPSADLPSTDGGTVNLSDIKGRLVLFIYPYTGRPNHPDPPGWDHIPGAHGSTPQARGFSEAYTEFQKFGMKVFGMSFQNSDWQREFVQRTSLAFPLLSDCDRRMASALGLETFKAGPEVYLSRRALVISDGLITHDFYPVRNPALNARDVLEVLRA